MCWPTAAQSPPALSDDKVIVHRAPRDEVQTRIVWKGGATTTFAVPVTVGAFADLQGAAAMEQQILSLCATGHTDEAIAAQLTQQGYRSPQRPQVLPSTVRTIRLKHGRMQQRHQSHPRRWRVLTVHNWPGVLGLPMAL